MTYDQWSIEEAKSFEYIYRLRNRPVADVAAPVFRMLCIHYDSSITCFPNRATQTIDDKMKSRTSHRRSQFRIDIDASAGVTTIGNKLKSITFRFFLVSRRSKRKQAIMFIAECCESLSTHSHGHCETAKPVNIHRQTRPARMRKEVVSMPLMQYLAQNWIPIHRVGSTHRASSFHHTLIWLAFHFRFYFVIDTLPQCKKEIDWKAKKI